MSREIKLTLAAARVNAGLTRKEVSRITGISVAMLGRYESGKTEIRGTALQKMCLLYKIGIEDLVLNVANAQTAKRGRPRKKAGDSK